MFGQFVGSCRGPLVVASAPADHNDVQPPAAVGPERPDPGGVHVALVADGGPRRVGSGGVQPRTRWDAGGAGPFGPTPASESVCCQARYFFFCPLAAVFVIRNLYGASRVSIAPLVRFEITTVKLSFVLHWVKDCEMSEPSSS